MHLVHTSDSRSEICTNLIGKSVAYAMCNRLCAQHMHRNVSAALQLRHLAFHLIPFSGCGSMTPPLAPPCTCNSSAVYCSCSHIQLGFHESFILGTCDGTLCESAHHRRKAPLAGLLVAHFHKRIQQLLPDWLRGLEPHRLQRHKGVNTTLCACCAHPDHAGAQPHTRSSLSAWWNGPFVIIICWQ